jgi:NAD+ kinase
MKVGVLQGPRAQEAIVERISLALQGRGIDIWAAKRDEPIGSLTGRLRDTKLLVTLGGDGTFLAGARLAAPRGIPILGVNLGRLGFLTELEADHLERGLDRFVAGAYRLEERTILQVTLNRAERRVARAIGLNEVVVDHSSDVRMVRIEIAVDGQRVGVIDADGVIVATATGSTAYALASGGPILEPTLRDLLLVPLNPFALTVRPIVFPPGQDITLTVVRGPAELHIDGARRGRTVETGDIVRCGSHPRRLKVVRFSPPELFYSRLADKLGWGRPLVPMK